MQSLQGQPSGTHFLILLLKIVKEHAPLISLRILFHILAAILAMDSIPKCVGWILSSCHVTNAFQSQSTLYSCLNVKERLTRSRREIWSLSDYNWNRTRNHLVRKQKLNHLGCGLEFSCSHVEWMFDLDRQLPHLNS